MAGEPEKRTGAHFQGGSTGSNPVGVLADLDSVWWTTPYDNSSANRRFVGPIWWLHTHTGSHADALGHASTTMSSANALGAAAADPRRANIAPASTIQMAARQRVTAIRPRRLGQSARGRGSRDART